MNTRNLLGVGALVLALGAGSAAYAQTEAKAKVDAAKAAGIVGEQADGMLGLVAGDADPAIKAAVAEINTGRSAVYREAAARNGVTIEAAGASTFQTVIQAKIKPGEFYKPAGGGWVKK